MRRIAARQLLVLAALACFAIPFAGGESFAQQGGGERASSGSVTASAAKSRGRDVRRLQRKLGIPADGVVGRRPRRALGLGPGETLKRGGADGSGGDVPAAGPGALGRLISA